MPTAAVPAIERWFAAQGAPARIDLARNGARGLDVAECLALAGASTDELLAISLDYGPGQGEERLRRAIATAVRMETPDNVLITHGAVEALLLVCLGVRPRTTGQVVVACPAYSGLLSVPASLNLAVQPVAIWNPIDGLVVDHFIAALGANTDLAIINSPHNPSGATIPLEDVERIAQRCAELGIVLVVDEVGRGTLDPGATSAVQCGSFAAGHMVVIGDVSKAMGLGGLRVGWMITAHRSVLARAAAAKDCTTVTSGALTQFLAALALENAARFLDRVSRTAMRNRTELDRLVDATGACWVAPHDGLVGFPMLPSRRGTDELARELLADEVGVVPGSLFGWPRHLRVGLGAPPALFAEGLERIAVRLGFRV